MSAETFRFNLGAIECIVVSDGYFAYPEPHRTLFANPRRECLDLALREHGIEPQQWQQYVSPYSCVVVNTGRNLVLVDTGAGDREPTTGKLLEGLQAEGIRPGDIDTVILTHAHSDHIGGVIDRQGNPVFANARHVMWKTEWEFWTAEPSLKELIVNQELKFLLRTIARNILTAIQDQIDLIDREGEIVPGVRAVSAPGHTPGHMAVCVSSGRQRLLCVSDAVIHPIHLEHPDWHAAVDLSPRQVQATRYRLFDLATIGDCLLHAMHFAPFPSMGRAIWRQMRWEWEPVVCENLRPGCSHFMPSPA